MTNQNKKNGWLGISRIALLAIVALVAFAAIAFSDGVGGYAQSSGQAAFSEKFAAGTGSWYPAAIAAILLSVFFNVLVYMAGEAFRAENLKRYAKAEFLQTTASALIIVFAVYLLYGISGSGHGAFDIMGNLLGNGASIGCAAAQNGRFFIWGTNAGYGEGPIAAFQCKTQERIDAAEAAYSNIYSENMYQEALTSFCVSFFGFPVWCYDWDLQWHMQVEENHFIASKLVSLLVALHAEYALAGYVQATMLSVFLPLGLVLRILPFTRGVGGLFIAMAVSFFFIWPTFAVLSDPSLVRASTLEQPNSMLQQGCFTGFKGAAVIMSSSFSSTFGGVGTTDISIEKGTQLLTDITISAMFYPFIAFVVSLIAIRAMTPLLGGDLGELMRMVARLG